MNKSIGGSHTMNKFLAIIAVMFLFPYKTASGQVIGMGYLEHFFMTQGLKTGSGPVTVLRLPEINGVVLGLNLTDEAIAADGSKSGTVRGTVNDTQFVIEA